MTYIPCDGWAALYFLWAKKDDPSLVGDDRWFVYICPIVAWEVDSDVEAGSWAEAVHPMGFAESKVGADLFAYVTPEGQVLMPGYEPISAADVTEAYAEFVVRCTLLMERTDMKRAASKIAQIMSGAAQRLSGDGQ